MSDPPGFVRSATVHSLITNRRVRWAAGCVALTCVYYGAAQVSFHLEFAGPVAAILWLPVGVAISFLYFGGLHLWPGALAGDLMVNDYGALTVGAGLAQSAGNLAEVIVATAMIRRLVPEGSPLESVRGLGRLLASLATGVAISATIGTISLRLAGVVHMDNVPTVWRTWWLGDFVGALVVVPLALAWYGQPFDRRWPPARIAEALVLLVTVVVLSDISSSSRRPVVYVVFPVLIWAALRFGPRGATATIAIAVWLTVTNTTHYVGPFAYHSITRSVFNTQLFIGVTAVSTLYLSAVVAERQRFALELGASRSRLVEAGDVERRRLERNLHDGAQQRLVALALTVRMAERKLADDADTAGRLLAQAGTELEQALAELREIARGLHPAVLTERGLGPALDALATRAPVPVDVGSEIDGRLPGPVEAAAYYVVSEALTNVAKYAGASAARVGITRDDGVLVVEVADDGVGG
ncbi:MAG TPA: MASE1 domain-containing protein, partial [Gaiellales bacterium]|nr:MASE1 domain-containing protein [Gaiellales bacterium]